jgi:hypothetical protein
MNLMDHLLSPKQFRERFLPGVSRAEFYSWLERGIIPSIQIGRRRYVLESAFDAFVKSNLQPAPQQGRFERGVSASPTRRSMAAGAPRVIRLKGVSR